ncbi:MAG: hypothetical protein KDC95_03760 [Planctomycetes bacterium]|nr:hypothetical protein [Planctomycetota bacterium]
MQHPRCLTYALLSLILASASAFAQRTWIVDLGGNGDFKTVTDAVAAVAAGDRILVGPGTYAELPTITKSLSLLGDQSTINGFVVRGIARDGRVLLSGFHIPAAQRIILEDNSGHIALTGCRSSSTLFDLIRNPAVEVRRSVHVTMHDCAFSGTGVIIDSSDVAIAQSLLSGVYGAWSGLGAVSAGPGIRAISSRVVLSFVDVIGGSAQGFKVEQPSCAIDCRTSIVTVAAPSSLIAGKTSSLRPELFFAPAVQGDSVTKLHVDTLVRVEASNSQAPLFSGVQVNWLTTAALKGVVTRDVNRDFLVDTELHARPNWMSALLIGLPGARTPIDPIGDLWIDPAQPFLVLDIGATGQDSRRAVRVRLPSSLPDGTLVAFQSLVFDQVNLRMSTPLVVVLH